MTRKGNHEYNNISDSSLFSQKSEFKIKSFKNLNIYLIVHPTGNTNENTMLLNTFPHVFVLKTFGLDVLFVMDCPKRLDV